MQAVPAHSLEQWAVVRRRPPGRPVGSQPWGEQRRPRCGRLAARTAPSPSCHALRRRGPHRRKAYSARRTRVEDGIAHLDNRRAPAPPRGRREHVGDTVQAAAGPPFDQRTVGRTRLVRREARRPHGGSPRLTAHRATAADVARPILQRAPGRRCRERVDSTVFPSPRQTPDRCREAGGFTTEVRQRT